MVGDIEALVETNWPISYLIILKGHKARSENIEKDTISLQNVMLYRLLRKLRKPRKRNNRRLW